MVLGPSGGEATVTGTVGETNWGRYAEHTPAHTLTRMLPLLPTPLEPVPSRLPEPYNDSPAKGSSQLESLPVPYLNTNG